MCYRLENEIIKIDIDKKTGAIIGFLNKKTGWQIIKQSELAAGIRLLVPIEGHRNNQILSEKQILSSFVKKDELTAVLKWNGVTGEKSGYLDISISMKIRVNGNRTEFHLTIDNNSSYIIEEVWGPILGGFRGPENKKELTARQVDMCGNFRTFKMGKHFYNSCGYWGVDHPTRIVSYPDWGMLLPFELIENGNQGLYFGMHDETPNVLSFVHEFKPGYLNSEKSLIPQQNTISGKPCGFVVSAVRMPFIQPGEKVELAPIILATYKGTWHKGVEQYMKWRNIWYNQIERPDWLYEIDCWMTLHINSPEGCCRYQYNELVEIAREAKESGVQALQLIGWARDGQDGAEPIQDTDNRLGTIKDLKTAIKEIENMGVRVLLMCKFKWTDRSIPEYKNEIINYTQKDMYGNPVQFSGYAYQTLTQQLHGGSRRCGAGLCHLSDKYREFALEEFKKILSLGSSGILYDELTNVSPFCFSEDHNHRAGECSYVGSLELAKSFHKTAQKEREEFAMTGEGPSDFLSQYYAVNYIRTWGNHTPAWKYINPWMLFATCLTGWDDREMVNQCLAYGYIINYEPYNFKGRVTDIPKTVSYGMKAQKLRRRLWDYIWKGVFQHTVGVDLKSYNEVEYYYSVFINNQNGKKAVVVVNNDENDELKAKIKVNNTKTLYNVYQIEDEEVLTSYGDITIPPRSLAVMVEQ